MTTLKKHPITSLLIFSISLVFLSMQALYLAQAESPLIIYRFGGLIGNLLKVNPSDLWRLVTPIFVHIGWEHFLFNTVSLFFLGKIAEKLYGSTKFLVLVILSGIMGNVFVLLLTPDVIVAGASTSIFGLFAAIMITGHFSSNVLLKNLSHSYRALIIINLLFNLITPGVSIAGHLGGLFGGLLLGIGLSPKQEVDLSAPTRFLAFGAYSIALISLVLFSLSH